MPNYSFKETILFFSEKLHGEPPQEDVEKGEVELLIDSMSVILSKGQSQGSLSLHIVLGLLLRPIREERLKELATSNFLGINTGGCTLAFDELGVSLSLNGYTTSGSSPQESWEWLHRLLCVAREWNKVLALWDEFIPLAAPREVKKDEQNRTKRTSFRA